MRKGLGVVIGRFQVPDLHAAHHGIIGEALQHQRTLILVGVNPNLGTPSDPLDYPARERMLKTHYPEAMVAPIKDQPTNEGWSAEVDSIIETHHQIGPVTLYGGRESFIPYYNGAFQTKAIDPIKDWSGIAVRDSIAQVVLGTTDFRQGIIYSCLNQYPRVFLTVDIAMVKLGADSKLDRHPLVLLGRKKTDPGYQMRFPGGFVNPHDTSTEAAARRELMEETGLSCEADLIDLGIHKVRDWRHPDDTISCIFTNLFIARYSFGAPVAGDDLSSIDWVAVPELERWIVNSNCLTDDHDILAVPVVKWCQENAYGKTSWGLSRKQTKWEKGIRPLADKGQVKETAQWR